MANKDYLFTSESVTEGHPDKVADQVSDSVLDAVLADDPNGRVACETLVTTDYCCLAGEITTTAKVDYEKVARDVIAAVEKAGPPVASASPLIRMGLPSRTCLSRMSCARSRMPATSPWWSRITGRWRAATALTACT